jgi:hypothetical protein
MKLMSSMLAFAVLATGAAACGGSGGEHQSADAGRTSDEAERARAMAARIRGNDSFDSDNTGPGEAAENNDDREVEYFGHPAGPAVRRAATRFAVRYLTLAAKEDGPAACLMVAPELVKRAPHLSTGPSSSYLRGRNCGEVLTKLFRFKHRQLMAEFSGFKVTAVRVDRARAMALMAFTKYPEKRFFELVRVGRAWKLEGYLDADFP